MLPLQPNVLAEAELKNMGLRVIYFRPKQGKLIILNVHREKSTDRSGQLFKAGPLKS